MAAIVSLSKLFATGHLGSLHSGLSLSDAALVLGPPESWSQRTDPLHGHVWVWHYGELELAFGSEPPWPLHFFALEGLPEAGEPPGCLIVGNGLGPAMVLELDGIDRKLRPSDALSLVLRRGHPTQILYWPLGRDDTLDPSLLTIGAGDVAVSFEVWDDELGGNTKLAELTDAELWRALGAGASVHRLMCGVRAADPVASGSGVAPRLLDLPAAAASCRDDPGISAAISTRTRPAIARVRFGDFLATGHLGPVHCGLNRNQIALLLGAPDGWIGESSDEMILLGAADWPAVTQPVFPHYWCYGKLELSFDGCPPHAINFFQIELAHLLADDCEILVGGRIVLELQGLGGRSRPADFLRVMRGTTALHVIYSHPTDTGSFELRVSHGRVGVGLVFDSSFPDDILPELAALDDPAYLRRCDRFAQLDSIYAYPMPDDDVPSDTKIKVAAAEYLAAMTGVT